jgi:hypothetical protein
MLFYVLYCRIAKQMESITAQGRKKPSNLWAKSDLESVKSVDHSILELIWSSKKDDDETEWDTYAHFLWRACELGYRYWRITSVIGILGFLLLPRKVGEKMFVSPQLLLY